MSANSVTDWTIPGSDDQPIYGNTHWPEGDAAGALICAHGFKGYKDYGFFPMLCRRAASRGLIAVRFNFSHSGMTNRIETFEHPDLFEKDRWGRQVDDLKRVFDDPRLPSKLPRVVFGHSRGGVTSTLFAGNSAPKSLAGLVTAAAPDYACKMDGLVKDQLRAEGRLCSPSGRTGQDLYVGLDWLQEIENDPERYNPVLAAARATCPMLIMHGDADETVPVTCANKLHQAAAPRSDLAIIEAANHIFNSPNPLPADTPDAQLAPQTAEMVRRSVAFAMRCCESL